MKAGSKRQRKAKLLRNFRKIHRYTGASLFLLFFIVSITGILLGWKKHSGGLLLPGSYKGTTDNLSEWLPLDSLHKKANNYLYNIDSTLSVKLDRIDIRKDKGMLKFVYSEHFYGLQLDGATGKLLHIERRRSDYIEKIHDGSILDFYFNTSNGQIKLFYTSLTGLALLTFTVTGFWLWYGPKRMRSHAGKHD